MSLRRALLIAAVLVVAGAAGVGALLSPVSPRHPRTVPFLVLPGETLPRIASTLRDQGLVRERRVFILLARVEGVDRAIQAGAYRASTGDWAWEILDRLARGEVEDTTVTVPEGLWMTEIAALVGPLVAGGADSFLAAARDSLLLAEMGLPGPSAEGYLFPDTYRFAPGGPARFLVRHMVKTFQDTWERHARARADSLGLDPNQVVTLASIVEAEARRAEERPRIAAVYWNRLRLGMPLQADPTVAYARGERLARTLYADLDVPSPYNTYRMPGLPPGPIGNPGLESIRAALWPLPGCHDLYFVAQGDGSHLFAADFETHRRNRRAVERSER